MVRSSQGRKRWNRAAWLLLCVALLGAAWLQQHLRSAHYYQTGTTSETAGDWENAIEQFEWCIHCYAPGSPYPSRGVQALIRMGQTAENNGATQEARLAWQSLGAGLRMIRHIRQPFPEALDLADERYSKLSPLELSHPEGHASP